MKIIDILHNRGIVLYVADGKLKYKAPKNAMDDESKNLIAENRDELIDYLQSHEIDENKAIRLYDDIRYNLNNHELSFGQQRLWMLQQLAPDSSAYNINAGFEINGNLDIDAFSGAIARIIERHKVLRTCFSEKDGQVSPNILLNYELPIELVDLDANLTAGENPASQALLKQSFSRPFDLTCDLMIRVIIIRISDEQFHIGVSMHHIAADGWSIDVLISELSALYQDLVNNISPNLDALPVEYSDYAKWQRQELSGDTLQSHMSYWKHTLDNIPDIHSLPLDRARPSSVDTTGASLVSHIPADLSERARVFCSENNMTLFMLLETNLALLMKKFGRSNDIVIGTPIAGRLDKKLEPLIGFFVNTLVLRTELSPRQSFIEFAHQNRDNIVSAFKHQHVPFELLVEELNPSRSLSHNPLFQIMFSMQHQKSATVDLGSELTLKPLANCSHEVRFDLEIEAYELADGLDMEWKFQTALFDTETVHSLSSAFVQLLENVLNNTSSPIGDISLLCEEEKEALVTGGNNKVDLLSVKTINECLDNAVSTRQDAIALVCGTEQLSFHELEERVNALAGWLLQKGVKPNDIVGVCLDRSVEMVISMLAVVKAGGAFLPIERTTPPERIAAMLEDAGCNIFICESTVKAQVDPGKLLTVTRSHLSELMATSCCEGKMFPQVGLNDLVYVIYTSGSTGKPKGVMIEHSNLANFRSAMADKFDVPNGKWLAATSSSFDISILEWLVALSYGYQVVLAETITKDDSALSHMDKDIDFSLFFFASDDDTKSTNKYDFLLSAAKFADNNDFTAVWTPERHFGVFGGMYPNPAITSSAIAATTSQIDIRAGSCVLGLHNPVRVAEDWSVIDNLSGGRVGVAFASGWHPNDFCLAPDKFENRRENLNKDICTIQRLWQGDSIPLLNGVGKTVSQSIRPKPVQSKLPTWITVGGNPEGFKYAGQQGYNVLTHLLGQSVEQLSEKVEIYRQAWQDAGHEGEGKITLMLHTFVASDDDDVVHYAKEPFKNYLAEALDLIKSEVESLGENAENYTENDIEALKEHAFNRYHKSSALIGNADQCLSLVDKLKGIGIDELACLIDFGVDSDVVLDSLQELNKLRTMSLAQSRQTPLNVVDALKQEDITHFQTTPSLLSLILQDDEAGRMLENLKHLLVGGEALPKSIYKVLQNFQGVEVTNVYGPTESTIWSTSHKIQNDVDEVLIGNPLLNNQLYIVDDNLNLVPEGATGELLIGGAGVARGYINNEALTNERFINVDFGFGVQRVYRTGDLVRRRNTSGLTYIGRIDNQVKIRGYRIELGEVENQLVSLPYINSAAVAVRESDELNKFLVAFIEVNDSGLDNEECERLAHSHLQRVLPHYMVPNAIKVLDKIPLNSSGKINRKALPDHIDIGEQRYQPPVNTCQKVLCAIWGELLSREQVGITDNFFELGGHSLLVGRVVSEVRQKLNREISVRQMFERPTIAELSELLSESQEMAVVPELKRLNQAGKVAMSYAQQRLWFIDNLEGGSPQYNIPASLRFNGELDVPAFEKSIQAIIQRHESLRTTFSEQDDEGIQVIHSEVKLPVTHVDLTSVSEDEREQLIVQYSQEDAFKCFDLRNEVPLRITILKLADAENVVLFNMHHIASDGWSMGILIREFNRLYDAFSQGQDNPLEPLPVQYADYASWQRNWLQGEVLSEQLSYWKEQLSGLPQVHNLPLDKPRPVYQQFEAASHDYVLPATLRERIYQVCQEQDVTLFMFLQTVFSVLLSRYSNEKDIVIGAPIAGRVHKDTESLIGFFVNSLVLRTSLEDNPSFEALLQRNKQMILDAYDHQHVPFEMLVDELQPERSLAYSPLFQVTMTLHNQARENLDVARLQHVTDDKGDAIIRFDMELAVIEREDGILLRLRYKDSLFDASSIQRMLNNYAVLIEGALSAVASPVARLPLLSSEEYQLQSDWTHSTRHYPTGECLHEVFETQAALHGSSLAVRCAESSLSYDELNARSNQLARSLLASGAQSETRVGLCVERSVEMMVGLLGILKAGCAYVPLEPGHPTERLRYQLSDAELSLIVSHRGLAQRLPLSEQQVVLLDDGHLSRFEDSNLPRSLTQVSASSLAYVIYTSGSTGHPKGTLVEHASLMNFLYFAEEAFMRPSVAGSVVSSPIAFDATVQSLYVPLLSGRYVEFLEEDALPIESLADYLFDDEDELLFKITPSHLKAVEESGLIKRNEAVRHVLVVAGEQLDWGLLRRWQDYLPNASFINEYGPTEATVGSTTCAVSTLSETDETGGVPIGRPIGNARCYVLDTLGQPVPVGVPGELYIGGAGVCRGYLNQAALTSEKFVHLPDIDAGRLYRTGDRVRWTPAGQVSFIGRMDNQVKLRGFRVELGEIESSLERHEGIEKAVVNVHEGQLVGYILADKSHAGPVRGLAEQEAAGAQVKTMRLDNGMVVGCLNEGETRYTYEEIFEQEAYLSCGIELGANATVLDVGANTGMFSLFLGQRCPDVRLYSFEPIPSVFDVLSFNTRLYGLNAHLIAKGVSDQTGEVEFTYYPHNSLISSRYGDQEQEIEDVKRYLRIEHRAALASGELTEEGLDELLRARLESEQVRCEITTLSDVIAEQHLSHIDLLKIDVQKSEMDVLQGLRASDWRIIQQVIIEVHDIDDRVDVLCARLAKEGFNCRVMSPGNGETGPHKMVYGVRPDYQVVDQLREKGLKYGWNDGQLLVKDAQEQLRRHLASYMVPERYVMMAALPLNANGKVDRKALPDPDKVITDQHQYVAPRTKQEQILCDLWAEVLKLDRVGIDDNFYGVGGDSIVSIQLVARSRKRGINFTVRQLFECQSVRELAKVINCEDDGTKLAVEECSGELAMLPAQQAFFSKKLPKPEHYNQSVLLEVSVALSQEEITEIAKALYQKHDAFRLRFSASEEQTTAHFVENSDNGFQSILSYVQPDPESNDTQRQVESICSQIQSSFDLSNSTLFKLVYIAAPDQTARIFLVAHHLLVDGVSWRILLNDLSTAISQLVRNEKVDLIEKTNSLKQWSDTLLASSKTKNVQNQRAYWQQQLLADNSELKSNLGKGQSVVYDSWSTELDTDITEKLHQTANRAFNTKSNELLFAALVWSLKKFTTSDSIGFLMESHGREDLDSQLSLSETIGWFTSEYPLSFDVSETAMVETVIKQSKESLRAVPDNGIGFGILNYVAEETLDFDPETLKNYVKFNYLGELDGSVQESEFLSLANENTGDSQAVDNLIQIMPVVNILIAQGKLKVTLSGAIEKEVGSALLAVFEASIVSVVNCCERVIARQQLSNNQIDDEKRKSLIEDSFDL